MQHGVELIGKTRSEIVADPFGFGTVDHANRPLQTRLPQTLCGGVTRPPCEQKSVEPSGMEQRFVAVCKRRPNPLALGGTIPIGGCGDGPVVCCKPDQHSVVFVTLTSQLPDVELAPLSHLRDPCIAYV